MRRFLLILPAMAAGMGIAVLAPQMMQSALVFAGLATQDLTPAVTRKVSAASAGADDHAHDKEGSHKPEGVITLSAARLEAAQIAIADVGSGIVARRITVPGTIMADSDRLARIPARVAGTVSEMRKRLGDTVVKGEVMAILDSREVAAAKSEYLTASVTLNLQKTLFDRAEALWAKRVSSEQQYLQARATFTEAELRAELARQKLSALNLDATEVAAAAKQDSQSGLSSLRTYELRAPKSGSVVERKVDVGAPVGSEGDASELYIVADLSVVWVELAAPMAEVDLIKDGQHVVVTNGRGASKRTEGKIVFISPMLNQETRSARVIASVDNQSLAWRPGTFVTADIIIDEQSVDMHVPRTAVQTVEGVPVVFVRTDDGFERREVALGKSDDKGIEIVFGLFPGEKIAVANTFLLKAELGKAEAEHSH